MNRRRFIGGAAGAVAALSASGLVEGGARLLKSRPGFSFCRLRYSSGNWDADPKMPTNLLNSLVEYTSMEVDPDERIVSLDSDDVFSHPFAYLTGNRIVRFSESERRNFVKYVRNGGFVFVDDCNHDIDGVFARTFEREMDQVFTGAERLRKIPADHRIYRSFFEFPEGPPTTSHELNGWGDDLVHDYLKAVEVNGRIGVLYSNKDYGCEWNYDYKNKRFSTVDNTRFGVNIVVYAMTR